MLLSAAPQLRCSSRIDWLDITPLSDPYRFKDPLLNELFIGVAVPTTLLVIERTGPGMWSDTGTKVAIIRDPVLANCREYAGHLIIVPNPTTVRIFAEIMNRHRAGSDRVFLSLSECDRASRVVKKRVVPIVGLCQ